MSQSYKTHLASFLLESTIFQRIKGNNKCFRLTGNNNRVELCKLDSSRDNFLEEWDKDFRLFKIDCRTARPEIQLTKKEEDELAQSFKEKIAEVKLELIRQRTRKIKGESQKNEAQILESKINKFETVTLEAVKKELKLERLLEKEEKEKEDEEMTELEKQVENEKKKDECLIKAIKQKEVEDQANLARSETERKIEELKKEAKKEIIIKRNELRKKIILMRKKQQRKKNMLKQKVLTIRTQMAMNIQRLTRDGSKEKCKIKKDNVIKIKGYCIANFAEDYFKLNECLEPESFCYICCENEFGEAHITKRDNCYNMCDSIDVINKHEKGSWQWSPK